MTSELPPLASLVSRANVAGLSFREMERRAQQHGHSISHSQLAAYAENSVKKAPDVKQMEAIASALDLGYEVVRAAAFEQYYGYVPREVVRRSDASRVAAAIPPNLPPEEEAELLRMIRAWVAARDEE